jgi:hypothetical protein
MHGASDPAMDGMAQTLSRLKWVSVVIVAAVLGKQGHGSVWRCFGGACEK